MLTDDKSTHPNDTKTYPIRVALQTLLEPQGNHRILVATTTSGKNIVGCKLFERIRQMTFAAYGVIDAVPSHPFHILVAGFPAKAVYLPGHMVVACATDPLTAAMTFPPPFLTDLQ